MQKHQYPSIDLTDAYTPLAVWSFNEEKWQLLKVERPAKAIALCQTPSIMVFPTGVHPRQLERQLKSSVKNQKYLRSQRSTVLFNNSDRLPRLFYADVVAVRR